MSDFANALPACLSAVLNDALAKAFVPALAATLAAVLNALATPPLRILVKTSRIETAWFTYFITQSPELLTHVLSTGVKPHPTFKLICPSRSQGLTQ